MASQKIISSKFEHKKHEKNEFAVKSLMLILYLISLNIFSNYKRDNIT